MLAPSRCAALLCAALVTLSTAFPAHAAYVDANAMIYQAGGNTPPNALDPVLIAVPGGAGLGVSFVVSGSTDCDLNGTACSPWTGDGNLGDDVLLGSIGALSGVRYRGFYSLPLFGVFLGPALPGVSPTALDFREAEDFVHLFPQLGQVFWIGDGLHRTGFGVPQEFHVPAGATRLFVGFYDPIPNDNAGGLNVLPSFHATTDAPATAPGTLGLTASPNPARRDTRVRATLPGAARVVVRVTDAAGRHVRTLADDACTPGAHQWIWDGADEHGVPAGPGVYFAALLLDGRPAARTALVRVR